MRPRKQMLLFGGLFLLCALIVKLLGEDFTPNTQLFQLIIGARSPPVDPIMIALSNYGEYFWIPVTFLIWFSGRGNQRRTAYLLTSTFILGIILGVISKQIVGAPRPPISMATVLIKGEVDLSFAGHALLVSIRVDPSFPSGHALLVSIGASFSRSKLSRRIAWPLILEAILVSFSRLYVGVHWPVDILGGWLLGGFCVFFVLFLAARFGVYPLQGVNQQKNEGQVGSAAANSQSTI